MKRQVWHPDDRGRLVLAELIRDHLAALLSALDQDDIAQIANGIPLLTTYTCTAPALWGRTH